MSFDDMAQLCNIYIVYFLYDMEFVSSSHYNQVM